MVYLKCGIALICIALAADLVYLIHKWMPQINIKILIGLALLFILPCITFNTLFPAFYFHFFCFLAITQLIYFLIHKPVNLILFVIPLVLTAGVLGYGVYNLRHIQPVTYTLTTSKDIKDTRIVYLADFHYPNGMTKASLKKLIAQLKEEKPDYYCLGGDIVDEFTTRKELKSLSDSLGALTEVAPVYYVYGNHDNQHYSSKPVFTKEEIKAELSRNNIQTLQDTVVQSEGLLLIGREDAEQADRKELEQLMDQNNEAYTIVLDHQPVELEICMENGVDLQLSGHTHNGQIFPLGLLSSLFQINEHDYGILKKGDFTQITTSGINGWGFPLRTQGQSEYLVVQLKAS